MAEQVCVEVSEISINSDAPAKLVQAYKEVRVGLERFPLLMAAVEEQSPTLCLSNMMDGAHGYYDTEQSRIVLSSQLSTSMLVAVLIHEIRHLQQEVVGICPSDALAMKDYARATFALEADASAISALVAWDMKENGNDGPWRALSDWPTQSDIASAFATEMNLSHDVSSAVSAAFNHWYESEVRRETYYLATCSEFLDRQDSSHAIPRYQHITPDFLDGLCTMPEGTQYECALRNVERSRMPNHE